MKSYTIYQNNEGIWCINYRDQSQRRTRKSLKTRKKSEALKLAVEFMEQVIEESRDITRFEQYADQFYKPGCPWTERRASFHRPLAANTLEKYRWYLDNRIMPFFKGMAVEEITDKTVSDFALILKYDGTTKNDIVRLVCHIIDEAVLDGIRTHGVKVMRFPKTRSSQTAISGDTIRLLWPDDLNDLYAVWNNPTMRDRNAPWAYAAMGALMLSAGLRSGEVRALAPENIELQEDFGVVYVERAFGHKLEIKGVKGEVTPGQKSRVAIIPEKTVRILRYYISLTNYSDFLFLEAGSPIDKDRINQRFRRVLTENSITERVTPHTLRFTFKSRTRVLVDEITGELLMGHSSKEMSEWYDRPVLKERAQQFIEQGVHNKMQLLWKVSEAE
jgi:integrase